AEGSQRRRPRARAHRADTTFNGSGISFNVGLRAADVSAQALIVHEFIKRLHSRYQREGISNSSPTETIVHTSSPELATVFPVA
ncbi:MAG: hypothetical protein ACRDNO_06165, partial [Trebonia sp.]